MDGLLASRSPLGRLAAMVGEFEPGTVAITGAGPGDAALISLRGAVRIAQSDVILHDKLVGAELLELAPAGAERIFVGKAPGDHAWPQERINEALVRHARAGRRVVRLKGGDPFVFGRGGEECLHLAEAGIPFEVIPGITAAFGAPATAGIPLTHRGLVRSFALTTGHAEPDDPETPDFAALARMDAIAFYMGVRNLRENCAGLVAAGLDARTPAAVIEDGTLPGQRTVVGTLGDIADRAADVHSPALVIIGRVVELRASLEWFERRPLHGLTIAVLRTPEQAAELVGRLASLGARVIQAPALKPVPPEDWAAVDAALERLQDYHWLVLTSANGVDALFARLSVLQRDARALAPVRIAAVGPATAARLAEHGVRADLVPPEAVGESLAETLLAAGAGGSRILVLRAAAGRAELVRRLEAAGAVCEDLTVYRTVCPEGLPASLLECIDAGRLDWVVFTSPSSAVNLSAMLSAAGRSLPAGVRLASIGPVTSDAVRRLGLGEPVEASPHDAGGLVAAIRSACAGG